LSHFSDTHI